MGIDTLSFEPSDELNQPNRDITLSGWRHKTLSFDAKVYLGFIEYVTGYEIGIGSRREVNSGELMDMAHDLEK